MKNLENYEIKISLKNKETNNESYAVLQASQLYSVKEITGMDGMSLTLKKLFEILEQTDKIKINNNIDVMSLTLKELFDITGNIIGDDLMIFKLKKLLAKKH